MFGSSMSDRISGAEYPQSSAISYCFPSTWPVSCSTGLSWEKFGISEVSHGWSAPMFR